MHLINPIYNSVACPLVQLRKLSVAGAQQKDGLGQRYLQAGDCFTALVIEKADTAFLEGPKASLTNILNV